MVAAQIYRMTREIEEVMIHLDNSPDAPEPLPFPFNQRTYCRYQPIEKRIEEARVLVIDCLLRNEGDLSEVAFREWGESVARNLQRERTIAALALDNILNNIERLVQRPDTRRVHLSEIAHAAAEFNPDAIVLSGTLTDFDFYHPSIIENFCQFIRQTKIPVLAICGGHQLVGLCFGASILTLDNFEQQEQRDNRKMEYQYRFVSITAPEDPVFRGINDDESGIWQDYTTEGRYLRVWQNHGLQVDRIPEGFQLLATAITCRNQMMVKRTEGQLIYTVQFHLEKSFQDLNNNYTMRVNPNLSREEKRRLLREEASRRTLWSHQQESRDGRIIFENFLLEALKHTRTTESSGELETAGTRG
jgi:GMP synthase-like glutamine amidotransferase